MFNVIATAKAAPVKNEKEASKPEREPNRYVRGAKILAKNDRIDVKTLADRAYMSETTAQRVKEAWDACVAALREVGRLPAPPNATAAKKKAPAVATETPTETVETPPAT
jgi:hypothetical protein